MATYANTTNPFIEINGNQHQKALKKNAPGMARPRKAYSGDQNNNVDIGERTKCFNGGGLAPIEESTNAVIDDNQDNDEPSKMVDLQDAALIGHWQNNYNDIPLMHVNGKSERIDKKISEAVEELVANDSSLTSPSDKCTPVHHELDVDDEVAQACRSLVEVVVQLSMGNENEEVQESLANKCQSSGELSASFSDYRNEEKLEPDEDDESTTPMKRGDRQYQHMELIKKLRLQLRDLEKYAYERGELGEQVPASVLAERQNIVIETLKEKLQLNLDRDKIEKLELEELKEQVDKEIDGLIDPLRTKEQLLNQLKTQLTDLERYVEHLHETLGRPGEPASLSTSHSFSECICPKHGICSPTSNKQIFAIGEPTSSILNNDSLPRTSRLIKGLIAQLICSDLKIQETIKKADSRSKSSTILSRANGAISCAAEKQILVNVKHQAPIMKAPQFHDSTIWTVHLDKIILATDSLVNLYSLHQEEACEQAKAANSGKKTVVIDESLVESVVRRQLVPALKDLLSYGLIDPSSLPRSSSYTSFLFDPYYLFSSLTCFPGLSSTATTTSQHKQHDSNVSKEANKTHVWDIFEDYYQTRSESNNFKNSSVKTLSQSFQLTPSMNGPIKITSKQALLIATDDIIERMIKCRPNGPDSHFKMLVYIALNQSKLATWLRIVFKNKSVNKKYYHNFSFVSQPDKMDRFLAIVDSLSRYQFKLPIDTDHPAVDQYVSAF